MTPKTLMTALLPVGGFAVAFCILGPTCPPENAALQGREVSPHERRPAGNLEVVPGVTPQRETAPRDLCLRRNLFEIVDRAVPPPGVVVPLEPNPIDKPADTGGGTTSTAPPQQARDPEFPYQYVGRFGPEHNPIAVFVANGDVLNARVGDVIGQFRLSEIGIESVEVAAASGARRRVALRP